MERYWDQQRLHRHSFIFQRSFEFFIHHPLMGSVHIHHHQPLCILRQHVDPLQLRHGKAKRCFMFWCRGQMDGIVLSLRVGLE